jgi:hypothetical protein
MNRVIILYAPDAPELKSHAEKIKKAFSSENLEPALKSAKECSIQDIIASDIVILGLKEAKKGIHKDLVEIDRALSGINLAGRFAGLFAADTESSMKQFVKSFETSGIGIVQEVLCVDTSAAKQINEWVAAIVSKYKEGLNERKI